MFQIKPTHQYKNNTGYKSEKIMAYLERLKEAN